MTADQPLTRREMRERERAQERDAAAPLPSRRALRDVARELDETSERAPVRRRPVQAPTSTGITVVDGATGSITAVRIDPETESAPEPARAAAVELRRQSVLGRTPVPEAPAVAGPEVVTAGNRAALILRFLVLVLAAFVIGVLIWMVADDAAAEPGAVHTIVVESTP